MSMRELLERRASVRAGLGTIDKASPNAALSDEAQRHWDTLTGELETIEGRINRQALLDETDRRMVGVPLDGGAGGFEATARQVTALDVVRAQMGATDAGAARAKEVSSELERRSGRRAGGLLFSMTLSGAPTERRVFTTLNPAGGPGGNLIQTDVSPNLIDRLRERIVIRALGATVLSGLQGNLSIPRLKTSATGQWVGENEAITASDPQTDAVDLTPKHVGGIVEISRNMVLQPSLSVARMVEDDLSKILADTIDRVAITGGGPKEPSGLLAAGSGVPTFPLGGTAMSWDDVIDLIASVDTSNALGGSLAFLANGRVVSKLRRTLKTPSDTASTFLMTAPNELAGYPLASTQIMPMETVVSSPAMSSLIFGDWSQLIIGFWSELDILVNPFAETAYSKGNVLIRAMATADVAIKQPLAFAALLGVATD